MNKIVLSLFDFVDFVSKTGQSKIAHVKNIKSRPVYNPTHDYYKIAREAIQEFHKDGIRVKDIDEISYGLKNRSKIWNYSGLITGYKGFLKGKYISYVATAANRWSQGELEVTVSPDLGLKIDGRIHFIQLYFKSEHLSMNKIAPMLALMNEVLALNGRDYYHSSILDIRQSRLHTFEESQRSLMPLLIGEARNFATLWNSL